MGSSKKKKGDGDGSSSSNTNAYHIPSSSKKAVQRLKEIFNDKFSDFEIYSALKDCNMDPDHAILFLLAQDAFQEVKSKQEKRKEMKEARELRNKEKNSDTSSSVEVGEEHGDEFAPSESPRNSNDDDKTVDKRDIVLAGLAPSSTSVCPVKTSKQEPPSPLMQYIGSKLFQLSDTLSNYNTRHNSESRDSVSLSGKQQGTTVTWNRGTKYPGMTMADIVRMGKPPHRHSQTAAQDAKPSHDSSHSQIGMQKDPQGSEIRNPISPSASSTASLNDKVSSKDVDIAADLSRLSFGTYTSGVSTAVSESLSSDSLQNNLGKEGSSALADLSDPRHGSFTLLNADSDKSVGKSDIVLAGSAPSSTLVCPVETSTQLPSPHSDTLSNFSTRQSSESRDSVSLSGKRPESLVNWNRGTTYRGMTMADIVRMGKPPHRHSQTAAEDSNSQFSSFDHLKPSHDSSHSQTGVQKNPQGSEIRNSISPSASSTASLNDKVSSKDVDIATDLSRLSFGTYTSGVSTAASESLTSDSLQNNLGKEGSSALADLSDPRNSWYAHQIRRCKMLELAKESRYNAFSHFPQYESWRPCIPNTYEYSSSSIPDSNYMNIIKPDARNPPLHGELQSWSLPTASEFAQATYLVDSVITAEDVNSRASSLPVSYSLPLPGASLAMGSALPQHMSAFPQSALQNSYRGTARFHDSLASVHSRVPQFISGASRTSRPVSRPSYFLDGNLGTPTNLPRQFHHEIPIARSAVGYGGIQSQYNEGTGHAVLPQQAWNSQLSQWDYGSSMRAVPNVPNNRSHSVYAENQLRFGYPQPQQHVRNYDVPGHSNIYNSQSGTIHNQQLRPGGLPFTQTRPSRPSDEFCQQRHRR